MKITLIICNLHVCQIGISVVLGNAIFWRNDKYYSFVQSIDLLRMNGLGKTSISLVSEEKAIVVLHNNSLFSYGLVYIINITRINEADI